MLPRTVVLIVFAARLAVGLDNEIGAVFSDASGAPQVVGTGFEPVASTSEFNTDFLPKGLQLLVEYPMSEAEKLQTRTYSVARKGNGPSDSPLSSDGDFTPSCLVKKDGKWVRCTLEEFEQRRDIPETVLERELLFRRTSRRRDFPELTVLEDDFSFQRIRERGGPEAANLTWVRISLPDAEHHDFPEERFLLMDYDHKINRFPRSAHELNRKDRFALHFKRMQERHGPQVFNFHPETFVLPADWERLTQLAQAEPQEKWIAKPAFGGQGRGIMIVNSSALQADVPTDGSYVVQRYIANPFLINGYKSTLRVYVLITSFDPLRVYLNVDGIAKFSTKKFSTDLEQHHSGNVNMHITNQAINAIMEGYGVSEDPSETLSGFRWSIYHGWRKYLLEHGEDPEPIWSRVKDALVKALLAAEPAMVNASAHLGHERLRGAFQLLGTDVDLDSNLRPWVIESNVNPTLHSKVPFERVHKLEMIGSMFTMVGFAKFDRTAVRRVLRDRIRLHLVQRRDALPADSPLRAVSDEALETLVDLEWEDYFRGSFERIYPVLETAERYRPLFEVERPFNRVALEWLAVRQAPVTMTPQSHAAPEEAV